MAGQSRKKLERLLKKAEELFLKYGYSGVSVDQIAFEASVSKMTLYKYFHSKEDLFIEVMKKVAEYHNEIIMQKINESYHAIEKVEALYTYMLQVAGQFPAVLTRDILEHPSILERVKELKMDATRNMWRSILEDGIKKGEVRPLDVDFVCQLLMGLPMAFIETDYFTDESKLREFMGKLFDFMKYGMLGNSDKQNSSLQRRDSNA